MDSDISRIELQHLFNYPLSRIYFGKAHLERHLTEIWTIARNHKLKLALDEMKEQV